MRRIVIVGLLTIACLALAGAAGAFTLSPEHWYQAKPKKYDVQILTQCVHQTSTCKNADYVAIELGFGKVDVTTGPCPSTGFNEPQIPLTDESFNETFRFTLGKHTASVNLSGKFVSARKFKGKIKGPKGCGGTASFIAARER
jgi:hypothetical protein